MKRSKSTTPDKLVSRGRKAASQSRAGEIRTKLLAWRQTPEPQRISLRALARELGTSHQLLQHYLDGLDSWQAEERAKRICARAEAEGRSLTLAECCDAIGTPGVLRRIERIKREAKRGRLNWADLKILKIWARQFPQAQEVLERYSRSVLKRKSFTEIVKENPWQEGETSIAWERRIRDECAKYGTDRPTVITEELLEKGSQGKIPPEVHLSNLITRLEAMGGILLLDGDRILYFVPSRNAEGRALLAELWEHREGVKKFMLDFVRRYGAGKYEKLKARICQRIPHSLLSPLDESLDNW
jgi:hypothetical protein